MTLSRQPYFEPDDWQPDPLPSGSLNPPGRKPPTAAGLLSARRSVRVPSIFKSVRRVPRRRRAA